MVSNDFFHEIELLVYDCDGVLTDNRVIVDQHGNESAIFNRGDGLAITAIAKDLNIPQLIISTEKNPIILHRAKKLNIEVYNGVSDKKQALINYCLEHSIELKHVMYIGNDVNDLRVMEVVGIKGCPKDAESEILSISNWVSSKNGGFGVIRDLYRQLLTVR